MHTSHGLDWVCLDKHIVSLLSVEKLPRLPNKTCPASAGLHSCNSHLILSNQSCRVYPASVADCHLLSALTEASLVAIMLQQASVCSVSEASMPASANSIAQTTRCLRSLTSCRQHVAQLDCRPLFSSTTSVLLQKRPLHGGNLTSDMPGDTENAVFHFEETF